MNVARLLVSKVMVNSSFSFTGHQTLAFYQSTWILVSRQGEGLIHESLFMDSYTGA